MADKKQLGRVDPPIVNVPDNDTTREFVCAVDICPCSDSWDTCFCVPTERFLSLTTCSKCGVRLQSTEAWATERRRLARRMAQVLLEHFLPYLRKP